MGMNFKAGGDSGRGYRRGKRMPMSEINVTPMVDVMLVLLIIFMVAAPLLQVGSIMVDLPETKGQQITTPKEPLAVTVKANGDIYIGELRVSLDDLAMKLKVIVKNDYYETIFVRGDRGVAYGTVMKVMGRINDGGFKKLSFVLEQERGGT